MTWEVRQGDAPERLREMPDESVQTVVTSPPYWGLRDYGTAEWEGGDAECDHRKKNPEVDARTSTLGPDGGGLNEGNTAYQHGKVFRDTCGKCGARRIDSQLGLEPTPEQYVANLVAVFREVRRVLRKDGTCWVNLGDCYNSATSAKRKPSPDVQHGYWENGGGMGDERVNVPGLAAKQLVGIPWRVAFALQADGWWLRSDIIWAKPNPMPESVTDRPTRAHEYLFLLTKSARYFYDADAIREEHAYDWTANGASDHRKHLERRGRPDEAQGGILGVGGRERQFINPPNPAGRNRRSVWEITTQPYPEAHFATFPTKLVEPCILAGSPPKCCGECGAPWERVTEVESSFTERPGHPTRYGDTETMSAKGYGMPSIAPPSVQTTGWRPTCDHDDDSGRSTVLDIFAGSGTTGVVALRHDRSFIGLELNPDYCELARNRIRDDAPLLNTGLEAVA